MSIDSLRTYGMLDGEQLESLWREIDRLRSLGGQPEHDRMTKEEAQAKQDWKGMNGATAFHLIERHADGWDEVWEMMNAWLEANKDE